MAKPPYSLKEVGEIEGLPLMGSDNGRHPLFHMIPLNVRRGLAAPNTKYIAGALVLALAVVFSFRGGFSSSVKHATAPSASNVAAPGSKASATSLPAKEAPAPTIASAAATATVVSVDGAWAKIALEPKYEMLDEAEVVWQKPPGVLKGVLFVAHGCNHGAIDFWPKSSACPKCIGLPEEVNITRVALSRGYAVLAISSAARTHHRCWHASSPLHHTQDSQDIKQVRSVFGKLLPREGLDKVPLYAMGASSGGAFVLLVAMGNHQLSGVCSQIMAAPPTILEDYLAHCETASKARTTNTTHEAMGHLKGDTKRQYHPFPPAIFVHMPRDGYTAALVRENLAILHQKGVTSLEVTVPPLALTPTFLAEAAGPEISVEQSRAIYDALKAKGMLDAGGSILHDPRHFKWRDVLKEANVPGLDTMRLESDASPVSELLNVLYAGHEIVSRTTGQMLDFFEANTPKAA